MKKFLLSLPPNRVRRNYSGGAQLDILEGKPGGKDSDRPEDWIGSTAKAINRGMPEMENEGCSKVKLDSGEEIYLFELFSRYPEHYLGKKHKEVLGKNIGFLAKFLDPNIRLHVQAHPTAEFARKHLDSNWGKLEIYFILGAREGYEPYIRLGFQRAPSPEEWRRIVLEQDIKAMDTCFDKIPVKKGDTWVVGGGVPHAIGEGLLLIEVMEPTDLVVRCEFEREGIVVPEGGRFIRNDPDLSFKIFRYKSMSVKEVTKNFRVEPKVICKSKNYTIEQIIGPAQTDCFKIKRIKVPGKAKVPKEPIVQIGIVTEGSGTVEVKGEKILLKPGSKFLTPAVVKEVSYNAAAHNRKPFEIVTCQPNLSGK